MEELRQLLGRVEGKQDMMITQLGRIEKVQEDHNMRLGSLETTKTSATAYLTAGRVAWGALAAGFVWIADRFAH